MRKTLLTKMSALALPVLAAIAPGCTRPVVDNQKQSYHKVGVDKFNENDVKHKAKLLAIMGNYYMPHVTDDGRDALFNVRYAEREFVMDEKGKTKARFVLSGEKVNGKRGVYVVMPETLDTEKAKKAKDNMADYITLHMYGERGKSAKITEFENVPELGTRKLTEQDCKFDFPEVILAKEGECWVFAEQATRRYPITDPQTLASGKGYNFYLVPKKGATIRVKHNGKITVLNENKILRPYFVSYDQIKENVKKQEAERLAKIEAEKQAKIEAKREKALERQAKRGKGPHKPRKISRESTMVPTKPQKRIGSVRTGLFSGE